MSAASTILVLGGARSGKSTFAEKLVFETGANPVYLATARPLDDEMVERIEHHRDRRPMRWTTVEEPLALVDALRNEATGERAILVDCLTLWITNLIMADANLDREIDDLAAFIPELEVPVVFVSNEVGQGIVPTDKMARDFRDHSGRTHQKIAAVADSVYFVSAGLPQKLK